MMMKRAKIACKLATIQNLMFHLNHHATSTVTSTDRHLSYPLDEYEYSCTNSPAAFPTFHLPFKLNKRKKQSHAPLPEDAVLMAAALEMFNSTAPSPALPGFGRTPMNTKLAITFLYVLLK
ncbi:hypothetical protein ACJIZ3_020418 [Penstemon smallii]|uniref:Uncharacterized protein n=1 Tax=Penstemon smallii TaxID=265156 RepID=A0ABD3SIJ1_9LAMI